MLAEVGLWVYNSENNFVGSSYHSTCCVKRVNRFLEEKGPILGHPTVEFLSGFVNFVFFKNESC